MRALRLAAATRVAAAAAGSTGAAATPHADRLLLTFYLGNGLGLCATDLQGHMPDRGFFDGQDWRRSVEGRSDPG